MFGFPVATDWARWESLSYWSVFIATFLGVAAWESARPFWPLMVSAGRRWSRHGILLLLSGSASLLLLRFTPVAFAVFAAGRNWGVLNRVHTPAWIGFALAPLVLDFGRYGTHWMYHRVPWLWRVHQVHHSDPDFDVSTAGRFHPLEAVLTHGSSLLIVAILGLPPGGVLVAKLLAAFQNLFEHANAHLPRRLDRWLGLVLITPKMHRTHHSEDALDQQSNLGEVFSWWDRLFGTYLGEPSGGAQTKVGLKGHQTEASMGLGFMLSEPFIERL